MPETAPREAFMLLREARLRALPATADEKTRTIDAVLSSAAPVRMYDWWEGEEYDEILLADGAQYPETRQIPFLDVHSRWSIRDQIGSIRDIRVEDDEKLGRVLVGALHFDQSERGQDAWLKARDGHLTDVSVGYRSEEVLKAGAGEKVVRDGREYEGPVRVVARWQLLEASAVPIGADPNAKLRAASRSLIGAAGPKSRNQRGESMSDTTTTQPAPAPSAPPSGGERGESRPPAPEPVNMEAERARVQTEERARLREIREAARQARAAGMSVTDADVTAAEDGGWTLQQSRANWMERILQRGAATPPATYGGTGVEVGREDRDSFRSAAVDGLLVRAGVIRDLKKAHARASEFAGASLKDLLRRSLELSGRYKFGMSVDDMMRACAGDRGGYYAQGDQVRSLNHGPSDFPNILRDVMHKGLQSAYAESPATYQIWTRRAVLTDLRTRYMVQLSELATPDEVNASGELVESTLAEKGESYRPATYGRIISIRRDTIINDDLNAFARIPAELGRAFKRKVNRLVYVTLMANAAMAEDSLALFHTTHNNLASGADAAVPSVATLGVARTAMRKKKGIKDDAVLDIAPRFMLVPPELYVKTQQVLGSLADPAGTNSEVVNPFRNSLQPIEEPELSNAANSGYSAAAWYLAAEPNNVGTLEVGFLNGVDAPVIEEEEAFSVLGMRVRAYMDAGVGVEDWRGLYKNPGE